MPDHWRSIDELPAAYRTLVEGVVRANANLTRSGISKLRYASGRAAAFPLIRSANVRTRVYLGTSQQRVRFLFFRGPVTEDVLLQLDVDFAVNAAPGPARPAPDSGEPVLAFLRIPPFFASPVSPGEWKLLAAKLGEKDRRKVVFLRIGRTLLGAANPGEMFVARVARSEPGAAQAAIAFQRILTPGGGTALTYNYEPATFLRLLAAVADWVRDPTAGDLWPVALPSLASPLAAERIAAAAVRGWVESRNACPSRCADRLVAAFLPPFEVDGFRGEVVLRLKQDGTLAERRRDDVFRLRLSVAAGEKTGRPRVEMSLQPPDFLVSGKLYERLVETLRNDAVVRTLFNDSGMPAAARARFTAWVREASRDCFVFRAKKEGEEDTDMFVLRALWEQVQRVAVLLIQVRITASGAGDYQVRFVDAPGSMEVCYSDLPGFRDRKDPHVPEYVLKLVHQLGNWIRALGAR
jgi:hypothetical protein